MQLLHSITMNLMYEMLNAVIPCKKYSFSIMKQSLNVAWIQNPRGAILFSQMFVIFLHLTAQAMISFLQKKIFNYEYLQL
jgi:hypothetical protein